MLASSGNTPCSGSAADGITARRGLKPASHPRRIGWAGTVALAMGGSNQSLFLITALFAGQGNILGQGSATVPLLLVGLLLSYAAAPGWTELVLMSPHRTGGIAAVCTEAFRPYGKILSTLTGVCYWWGWVPTCGVTAIMAAGAIGSWCLPNTPTSVIAILIVATFAAVNLCGVHWTARLAVPLAVLSAGLAFLSMLVPVLSGQVDWARSVDFHLTTPFPGYFGALTAGMAGLYLIGFGAPAFEAAACHVGETVDAPRNVPRAMVISAAMAAVYFVGLPLVWLGALGPSALGQDLGEVLAPTFAPIFGGLAKSAVIGFLVFNMLHGTLQPLAGAARTLAQLADDGVAPRFLSKRLPTDAPWAAILLTAGFAILFLMIGDPIWLIAAANFTYLIGIGLPSVAVWLLRRDQPNADRPFRAPNLTIYLGLIAAGVWGASAILGFEQFGLPTVGIGLLMAYSGAAFYGWRMLEDRRKADRPVVGFGLHVKLTGAMLLVLALDGAGYLLAVSRLPPNGEFSVALADIFVAVALLTLTVGIVLPGMIAHSAGEVSAAARKLASGAVYDFTRAMEALGAGRLDAAHASVDVKPVVIRSRDELGAMAESFNVLLFGVKEATVGLDQAREGLSQARSELLESNAALRLAKETALHDALHDGLTGLPNRKWAVGRLQRAVEANEQIAVCFVDLDRFKIVNDSLGHVAGDSLLVQAAMRIQLALCESGQEGDLRKRVLARFGGDEFIVVMDEIETDEEALEIANTFLGSLSEAFEVEGESVYCSASVGVTLSRFGYANAQEILRDADLAMFKAKSLGRSRVELFRPSLHEIATTRLHVENDMRRALKAEEFVLHYQPIVRLSDRSLVGFEALVRWQHPQRGLVPPVEFIGVAEETGLIVPLGLWVLRKACRKAFEWGERFGRNVAPSVSINLSPSQFAQPDLIDSIKAILIETLANPAQIKLEITEGSTIGNSERAVHVLRALKALGLQISIDDFGTGYSSLSYLHRLPIDMLKIDRSFVSDMMDNRERRQIIKTILGLAGSLGIEVVAEGIETGEQATRLQEKGCQFGQGYYFSRPLREPDADAYVTKGRGANLELPDGTQRRISQL